jgi:choline dehydrogenase
MGPDPAEGAVVDERARLHGLPAIRIADASIFPSLPRATTAMPTTVVGERVAELMLA